MTYKFDVIRLKGVCIISILCHNVRSERAFAVLWQDASTPFSFRDSSCRITINAVHQRRETEDLRSVVKIVSAPLLFFAWVAKQAIYYLMHTLFLMYTADVSFDHVNTFNLTVCVVPRNVEIIKSQTVLAGNVERWKSPLPSSHFFALLSAFSHTHSDLTVTLWTLWSWDALQKTPI